MTSFIHILSLLILIFLVIVVYTRKIKYKKVYENLFLTLDKHEKFLNEFSKSQEIINLKNSIKIYSKFQIILKISNCNYVTFFKYDYSQRYIILHFIISIDDKGHIIQNSILEDSSIISDLLILNILKSDNDDLYELDINNVKEKNVDNYIKKSGINKVYYQNIFKDKNNPLGFISLSYKDKDYILQDNDKIEILKIIEKMKSYL